MKSKTSKKQKNYKQNQESGNQRNQKPETSKKNA